MDFDYDYIIAGGGCAGLSLVHYLLNSSLKDKQILVLDKSEKLVNDKTWCYWSEEPFLPHLPQMCWNNVSFHSDRIHREQNIAPLHYFCINSLRFYQEIHSEISVHPHVTYKQELITQMKEWEGGARVDTENGSYSGKWVFNSLIPKPELKPHHIFLKQHFGGWWIEAEHPIFQQSGMTLMDFGIPQEGEVRFVYCLPFTPKRALVEFTIFSQESMPKAYYQQALKDYMDTRYPNNAFTVSEQEFGVIPMTNYRFPSTKGDHILNIGTAAGLTKPTTGYTFKRIQEDSKSLVAHLEKKGNPHYIRKRSQRFAFYDTLLLYLIQHDSAQIKPIFEKLFKRNPMLKILRFLDESTSIWADMYLLVRLPWKPFLGAISAYYFQKKWKTSPQPDKQPSKNKDITIEYSV